MNYVKLKVELRDYPKRLNRVLLLRDDLNMVEVGVLIGASLKCTFEHMFMFRKGSDAYVSELFYEECENDDYYLMNQYLLSDFGDVFFYGYDPGEGWDFKCTVIDRIEKDDLSLAYLLDAEGLGIWENNRNTFDAYVKGEIKPNSSKEYPFKGYFLPENLYIHIYGDFDRFDFEEFRNEFNDSVEYVVYDYLSVAHDNGYELCVNTIEPEFENGYDEVDEMFEAFNELASEYATFHISDVPRIKRVFEKIKKDTDEQRAFDLIQKTLLKRFINLAAGVDNDYLAEIEELNEFDFDEYSEEDDYSDKYN